MNLTIIDKIHPLILVVFISAFVSLFITIVYKLMTNQEEMKRLKDKQKEHQKKIKELQKAGKHKELLEVQKEAMDASMAYMRHSMKPTFITMIPLLFIFGWLNAHCVFMPIHPGEDFSLFAFFPDENGNATILVPSSFELKSLQTQNIDKIRLTDDAKRDLIDKNRALSKLKKQEEYNLIVWRMKAQKEGKFNLTIKYNTSSGLRTINKTVLITKNYGYENPVKIEKDITIVVGNQRSYFKFLGINFGWLGIYILSSIVFGNLFRKMMNVS